MNITVVFPEVIGDKFDPKVIISAKFDNLEAAGKYLREQVHPKVSVVQLRELAELKARFSGRGGLDSYASQLIEIARSKERVPPALTDFGLIPLPWQIQFSEHEDNGGDSFDLGVIQQTNPIVGAFPILSTCDWDNNLTQRGGPCDGNWNDCITSLSCNSFSKYWALCEHIHFQGRIIIGSGDVNSLVRPEYDFNDKTSSLVMNSTPAAIIDLALQALISGGG